MVQHSRYSASIVKSSKLATPVSSATLVTLPVPKAGQAPATYTVQVKGNYGTTGKYLVGFYLPGDAKGTGTVDATNLQTIMSEFGSTPSAAGTKYTFDADANRDGKISIADLQIASKNLGAKTTVSPVIDVNLDPATDGPLHSRITNFRTVHFTGSCDPGRDDHLHRGGGQFPRRDDHGQRQGRLQHHGPPRRRGEQLQGHDHRRVRPVDQRPDRAGDLHPQPAAGHQQPLPARGHDHHVDVHIGLDHADRDGLRRDAGGTRTRPTIERAGCRDHPRHACPVSCSTSTMSHGSISDSEVPARLSKRDLAAVEELAVSTHRVLGCRDLSRIDVRLRDGVAYFIEANPLPGLNPENSDLVILARGLGLTYDALIGRVLETTLARNGLL